MIGATQDAIDKAEDRERFRDAMQSIGLEVVNGGLAHSMEEAAVVLEQIGFPVIIRPAGNRSQARAVMPPLGLRLKASLNRGWINWFFVFCFLIHKKESC